MNRKTKLQRKAREEARLAEADVPRRVDDLGDSFPNDYLEALILLVCTFAIFGGFVALYYLAQKV